MAHKKTRTDRVAVSCINALFVLLLVLLLCAFLYAARPKERFRSQIPLQYTVCCRTVREEYVSDIHVGDTVLDAVGKRTIGKVADFTVTPAKTEVYCRKENCLRTVNYPDHVTLTLTVDTEAIRERGGYSVSGFYLIGGKSIPLRLPNFVGTGVCTDMTEISE